ncbi:Uncharacterised protein [Mycobacterium tuberculosis]|nr:Uncharacterised protein [Mycobacterium tuberculosis]
MESVSIQCGANRPQGRRRHVLVPVLLRLAAIAGFAFAGWFALSALHHAAYAADRPQYAAQADGEGSATLRHLTSRPAWQLMAGDVRDLSGDPVRYVRSRQRDLFDDKDRAVHRVRTAADAAGVPQVRLPDVRPERPVLGALVAKAAGTRPGQRPAAGEAPEQRADATGASHRASKDAVSAAPHAGIAATTAAAPGDGDCSRCHGDHRAPAHAPAQPGQDAPQGGGSTGGHPLTPVADLPERRHPAAPAVADAGTFRRTALTDVAAPGGPSVVPD